MYHGCARAPAATSAIWAPICIASLSESGILLISSELPEVINLSDRGLVMRYGRLAGELPHAQASPSAVLKLIPGRICRAVITCRI